MSFSGPGSSKMSSLPPDSVSPQLSWDLSCETSVPKSLNCQDCATQVLLVRRLVVMFVLYWRKQTNNSKCEQNYYIYVQLICENWFWDILILGTIIAGNTVLGKRVLGNRLLGNTVLGNRVLGNTFLGNMGLHLRNKILWVSCAAVCNSFHNFKVERQHLLRHEMTRSRWKQASGRPVYFDPWCLSRQWTSTHLHPGFFRFPLDVFSFREKSTHLVVPGLLVCTFLYGDCPSQRPVLHHPHHLIPPEIEKVLRK